MHQTHIDKDLLLLDFDCGFLLSHFTVLAGYSLELQKLNEKRFITKYYINVFIIDIQSNNFYRLFTSFKHSLRDFS